jgi:uncharacterized protein (TIGR03435 family)
MGQRLQPDERPVIDTTGLDGYYDFKLAYMSELPANVPQDRRER